MLGTDMFDHIKWSKIQVIWVLKEVERENEVEYIVGKKLAIISPNLKGFSFKNKCKKKKAVVFVCVANLSTF